MRDHACPSRPAVCIPACIHKVEQQSFCQWSFTTTSAVPEQLHCSDMPACQLWLYLLLVDNTSFSTRGKQAGTSHLAVYSASFLRCCVMKLRAVASESRTCLIRERVCLCVPPNCSAVEWKLVERQLKPETVTSVAPITADAAILADRFMLNQLDLT